jgi:hypothetical protein
VTYVWELQMVKGPNTEPLIGRYVRALQADITFLLRIGQRHCMVTNVGVALWAYAWGSANQD